MKKVVLILLIGLLMFTAAFSGFYYFGTAPSRNLMHEPEPELAWLKREFKLNDAEFASVTKLHEGYLPQCARRCQLIEEQNQKLQRLLGQATNVTPEIQASLLERAKIRAECETEMLKHFLAVSRTMPSEQGRRYLAWIEQQTFLNSQGMEQRHRMDSRQATAHDSQK